MTQPAEFAGKRVTVMGLGRFGGGVGVTRFLCDRGADVLVTDRDPADKLEKSLAQIRGLIDSGQVSLRLGEHNVSDFTTCDLVVVNPAVKPGNRFVRAAEAAGIEVTTEMRLLVQRLPNRLRTIGVTGSAGKSTVTAMIGHVLNKVFNAAPISAAPPGAGDDTDSYSTPSRQDAKTPSKTKVWVGGNIGVSLLPVLDQISEDDWVVLELSSFMLERLKQDDHFRGWSPHIAVITNISPNHLDWHGSMDDYVAAKQVIVAYQNIEGDSVNFGPGVHLYIDARTDDQTILELDDMSDTAAIESIDFLQIPGFHNKINALLAWWAIDDTGLDLDINDENEIEFEAYLASFPGLPHRLQRVAEHNGVRYFNDSKCTTPEAAMLAVQAFVEGVEKPGIHLILGGHDKGSDLKPLAGLVASHCKAVYTIGATGEAIAGALEGLNPATETASAGCEVVRCGELDRAVEAIQERVSPGDVVLLSPACASWDQFENYEQRGERFIELVNASIRS